MRKGLRIAVGSLAALALVYLGRWSVRDSDGAAPARSGDEASDMGGETDDAVVWTCPMHPQIRLPDPGPCPICGMDLVARREGGDDDPRRLALSPAAKKLAEIETAPVERRFVTMPVRMVGKVDYDETALRTISAWVPGRLDRLFVDYTGVSVSKGDHLVWLYSPELLSAQEELLAARARLSSTAAETSEFLAQSNQRAYRTAREKLVLFGLTEAQVDEIEERGTADDHVMLTSPASGVVVHKKLDVGAYVDTGTQIYTIADLSHLWVRLDAYEQDLPWLRYGQPVTLEAEALPGEPIEGWISFLSPVVDERTRTVDVRVNVDNRAGRLKPGMFVSAVASVRMGLDGQVTDSSLAGKWVSPMHPEIVKDAPGVCDVCGMALVPAEELGLVAAASTRAPLVVPARAVLVTGKRAVVYVEVPQAERPTYEGREVVLGVRAGEDYTVRSGLEEGERVVVNGAFRIDSSMQIRAKPSMMSMPGEQRDTRARVSLVDADARADLARIFAAYLDAQEALAADDASSASAGFERLGTAVAASEQRAALAPAVRTLLHTLHSNLDAAREGAGIADQRATLEGLTRTLLELEALVGNVAGEELALFHCPMAFDSAGADWLQRSEETSNPYFGAQMLRCGSLERTLPSQ